MKTVLIVLIRVILVILSIVLPSGEHCGATKNRYLKQPYVTEGGIIKRSTAQTYPSPQVDATAVDVRVIWITKQKGQQPTPNLHEPEPSPAADVRHSVPPSVVPAGTQLGCSAQENPAKRSTLVTAPSRGRCVLCALLVLSS